METVSLSICYTQHLGSPNKKYHQGIFIPPWIISLQGNKAQLSSVKILKESVLVLNIFSIFENEVI